MGARCRWRRGRRKEVKRWGKVVMGGRKEGGKGASERAPPFRFEPRKKDATVFLLFFLFQTL